MHGTRSIRWISCILFRFVTNFVKISFVADKNQYLGFSSCYFSQKLLQKRLPYKLKWNILISTAVGTVAAYQISSARSQSCQDGWLAAEDKHTSLTPITEK